MKMKTEVIQVPADNVEGFYCQVQISNEISSADILTLSTRFSGRKSLSEAS